MKENIEDYVVFVFDDDRRCIPTTLVAPPQIGMKVALTVNSYKGQSFKYYEVTDVSIDLRSSVTFNEKYENNENVVYYGACYVVKLKAREL
jgi:hypothetical protein